MKFLHTADIHLDRSFEGLKNIPQVIEKKLLKANQQTLELIADSAINNQVDLVILAGDTFHQNRTSIQTQAYFISEMNRLAQAAIPVAMIFGNHDYYMNERYWFDFPDNMILFKHEQVETRYIKTKNNETVALSAFSYEQAWIDENKLNSFPMRDTKATIHIGIYHGETKKKATQNYAPFTISDMKEKGYDYWALGHIHQTDILSREPLIVYPGTPQGHTIKEEALQGVAITTIENGKASVCFEEVERITWRVVTCSLEKIVTLQSALDAIENTLVESNPETKMVQLKELKLVATTHLGDEFTRSYESGELLYYLQKKILEKSQNAIFLFRIENDTQELAKKLVITATPDLLNHLAHNYLQPEIFTNVTNELMTNPMLSKSLDINEDWRQKSVQQAIKKIRGEFIFQEEQL